ncbi:unnamed protein product [Sphacelaria rigidula]
MARTFGTISATDAPKGARNGTPEDAMDTATGSNLCLKAFTVALDEASSQGDSCFPTKHLQLASLQLCIACRSTGAMRVKLDWSTPRTLWADPAEKSRCPMTGGTGRTRGSRVPPLRVRSVVWTSTANEKIMSRETILLSDGLAPAAQEDCVSGWL